MAKKKKSEESVESQGEQKVQEPTLDLGLKVRLEKSLSGRLTVTVKLMQGDKVIAEDYDFIQVD
jgi:hypothetical protein